MLSLVLPTYNESENLPELLPVIHTALAHVPHEILIVDDDSPDKTWKVAQEMTLVIPELRVIRRVGRRGLSSAVIEGFLAAKGSVLAVMDADGQHDLHLLPKLYEAVTGGAGMAIGSRYAEGGSVGQWDERRATLSRFATRIAISLCKVRVQDPMSGFFAIDRSTFETALPRLNPKGFKILLDLLLHIPSTTAVREIPFTFATRKHGESKLSRQVQLEFIEYLYEAAFGRFVPLTFVQYCIVGLLGVVVNLAVYLLFSKLLGEPTTSIPDFSPPLLAGIEAAIIFNFWLNNVWTFSSAKLRGAGAVYGFVRYNIACLFGALANYAVTWYAYQHGWTVLPSVAAGAFLGMIWNYTMSRLFTWKV